MKTILTSTMYNILKKIFTLRRYWFCIRYYLVTGVFYPSWGDRSMLVVAINNPEGFRFWYVCILNKLFIFNYNDATNRLHLWTFHQNCDVNIYIILLSPPTWASYIPVACQDFSVDFAILQNIKFLEVQSSSNMSYSWLLFRKFIIRFSSSILRLGCFTRTQM